MARFKFTWVNDCGEFLRVGYHSGGNFASALKQARRQMYVLGFNPYHCSYSYEKVEEKVAVKKKSAIIKSTNSDIVQSAFWWLDKDKES